MLVSFIDLLMNVAAFLVDMCDDVFTIIFTFGMVHFMDIGS